MEAFQFRRLIEAKHSYATRRVDWSVCTQFAPEDYRPQAGDVVLARVVSIGSHKRIELPNGRKATLNIGDEVLLAFGNRYAPDQYEAYVPETLEPCHMVAAGGVAARAVSWHDALSGPTEIEPIGVPCDNQGQPVNLNRFRLPKQEGPLPSIVFGVFGTSMNAGKTATAAALVHGFTRAGYKVGAMKITGTAAGGDPWLMRDSGALDVLDFTDAGHASTFGLSKEQIEMDTNLLLQALARSSCDVAIVEVADGLFHEETREIAHARSVRTMLDGVFFASGDALGAAAGINHLRAAGHTVLGFSGVIMRSPLAVREAVSNSDTRAYSLSDLRNPAECAALMEAAASRKLSAAE